MENKLKDLSDLLSYDDSKVTIHGDLELSSFVGIIANIIGTKNNNIGSKRVYNENDLGKGL